jgi:DNA-binding transcriptional LysR family regulator
MRSLCDDMQELTSLRYFIGIVDNGGFTAAARALNVSQPTLTRSLKNLEFQLDCVLLKRDESKMELTPEGELFNQRARQIVAEYKSMVDDVRRMHTHHLMKVLVRGAPITAIYILPEILARLHTEHPELEVSVAGIDTDYEGQRAAILAGDLDVALTIYDPSNAANGLAQELLLEPEAKLLVRRDHEALRGAHDLSSLAKYTWIVPPGRLGKSVMETEFMLQNVAFPASNIQISDWRIAIDMLEKTDYILVIPYHDSLRDYLGDRFATLPITLRTKPLALAIVTRPLGWRRSATKLFVETARQVVGKPGPSE